MSTQTLKHDRRKRHERKAASARAIQAKERAELSATVKSEALKMAVTDAGVKHYLEGSPETPEEVYRSLSADEKLKILREYIDRLMELGKRLKNELPDLQGIVRGGQMGGGLREIENKIEEAGREIIEIESGLVYSEVMPPDPPDHKEEPPLRNPGTNIKSSVQTGAMKTNALKSISKTDDELRVGNYIVLFGGRDLQFVINKNPDGSMGEYFTSDTDLESAYTKAGILDVDWEHGMGQELDGKAAPGKDEVLGYVDWKSRKIDDLGVWVERVLDRRNWYMKFLEILIDANMISNSSEAVMADVVTTKSGEIQKWPLMRDTLTVTPMEPRMMTENVIGAVKGLAKDSPGLKALLPQEPDDDYGEWTPESAKALQEKAKKILAEGEHFAEQWAMTEPSEFEELMEQTAMAVTGQDNIKVRRVRPDDSDGKRLNGICKFYRDGNTIILVDPDLGLEREWKTYLHEVSHELLHHPERSPILPEDVKEWEAKEYMQYLDLIATELVKDSGDRPGEFPAIQKMAALKSWAEEL